MRRLNAAKAAAQYPHLTHPKSMVPCPLHVNMLHFAHLELMVPYLCCMLILSCMAPHTQPQPSVTVINVQTGDSTQPPKCDLNILGTERLLPRKRRISPSGPSRSRMRPSDSMQEHSKGRRTQPLPSHHTRMTTRCIRPSR